MDSKRKFSILLLLDLSNAFNHWLLHRPWNSIFLDSCDDLPLVFRFIFAWAFSATFVAQPSLQKLNTGASVSSSSSPYAFCTKWSYPCSRFNVHLSIDNFKICIQAPPLFYKPFWTRASFILLEFLKTILHSTYLEQNLFSPWYCSSVYLSITFHQDNLETFIAHQPRGLTTKLTSKLDLFHLLKPAEKHSRRIVRCLSKRRVFRSFLQDLGL